MYFVIYLEKDLGKWGVCMLVCVCVCTRACMCTYVCMLDVGRGKVPENRVFWLGLCQCHPEK